MSREIPEELRALDQWVAWRYEERQGRRTKVPYRPWTETRASSTNPLTWDSYYAACESEGDGIGFVFSPSDPYVGVDMDACFEEGLLHEAAWRVVKALDSYYEISPSGNGLHVIVRGSIERGRHTLKTPWGNELAVYDRGRFFTFSGDGRGEIREAQSALDALIAHYFPLDELPPVVERQPVSDTDKDVLDRIQADSRMAALWDGDSSQFGGDASAGDLALCAHLAYLTGNDAGRIDALFRASARMRPKWDQRRGDSTYGQQTIARSMRSSRA